MLSLPSIEVLEYCLKRNQQNIGPLNILFPPSIQCLEKINQLLIKLIDEIMKNPGIVRFPNLTANIRKEITNNILRGRQDICSQHLKDLIKIEENYIWTDDQKFSDDLQKLYQNIKPNKIDHATIRSLINSYFETVKRSLMDRVPKEIMYYFISMVEKDINESLFEKIMKSAPISKLIEESPQIAEKRKRLTEQKIQLTSIKNMIESYN